MIDDLAKDQFITTLESPISLAEAYNIAVEEEKLWKEEESQFSLRRNASVVSTEKNHGKPETGVHDEGGRIQQLEEKVQELTRLLLELQTSTSPSKPHVWTKGNRLKQRTCFQCGQLGHFKINCPYQQTTDENQEN